MSAPYATGFDIGSVAGELDGKNYLFEEMLDEVLMNMDAPRFLAAGSWASFAKFRISTMVAREEESEEEPEA